MCWSQEMYTAFRKLEKCRRKSVKNDEMDRFLFSKKGKRIAKC